MNSISAGELRRATGLSLTTFHRRIVTLEKDGQVVRTVRLGGSEGTSSRIDYEGPVEPIIEALQRGTSYRAGPRARIGPICGKCGSGSDVQGRTAWCPRCRWGWLV